MAEDYINVWERNHGGFNFENSGRNQLFLEQGMKPPITKKTGTTICGVIAKDAVVLAADTRATAGEVIADKNADKLHYLAANVYTAGAGTAADLEHATGLISSQVELHRLATGTQVRVVNVVTRFKKMLFKYQGNIGCALVLGGVDINGPQLYQIYPHGSTDMLPFTSMGSGSLAAMSVLEAGYKDDMSVEEAKDLVAKAISSGILNDLGSGGNVDVVVIKKDSVEKTRRFQRPTERKFRAAKPFSFPLGTTPVLRQNIRDLVEVIDGDVEMS